MSIVGLDNRTQVTNTNVFPNSAVSNVAINFSGSGFGGSAMMVGPRHAITAGHNAYDADTNTNASALTVTPGLNNTAPPFFGPGNVTNVNFLKGYNTSETPSDDIALFTLGTAFNPTGGVAGLTAFVDPDDADGRSVATAGYPISSSTSGDGRLQYQASGSIVDTSAAGRMYYSLSMDTEGGQSGSGVWETMADDPTLRVIGVHAYGTGQNQFVALATGARNSGVLIDKASYDDIVEQMENDVGIGDADTLPENAIIGTDAFLGIFGGDDEIEGSYRKERVIAGSGDDGIRGAGADDRIEGGAGVDRAIYAGLFEDFDVTTDDATGETTVAHARGPAGPTNEGTDTLTDVEFAVFEKADENDNDVFVVPLPLEDGPLFSEQDDIENADGDRIGTLTLEAPAWMFDRDVDYTFTIGSQQGAQINFAYIIDVSGSMSGQNIAEAKNAYVTLTNELIQNGTADRAVFGVVPFSSSASLNAPLDANGAISAVQALSAGGGTSFGPALAEAESFFSSRSGGTNIAYFLSDGFGSGASNSLQTLDDGRTVEVRAFGIGGADLSTLNIIDSDNAVLLSDPSQLITEFGTSVIEPDIIDRVEVRLDETLIETVLPGQLTETSLGLSYEGMLDGLDVSKTAANQIEVEAFFNDGTPSTTVDLVVTTGQEEIVTPTAQGTKKVTLAVNQSEHIGDPEAATIIGNDLSNRIETGGGGDEVFANGGDDRIIVHPDGGLIDGGAGVDTAVFSQTLAEAGGVSRTGSVVSVGSNVTLLDVEFLEFSDQRIATDTLAATPVIDPPSAAVEVEEGADGETGAATMTVTLAQAAPVDVAIDFETIGGTATDGEDYTATTGSITIPAGDTQGTIEVEILGDDDIEANEFVDLRLTATSGATFAGGASEALARVLILEDDSGYAVSGPEASLRAFEGVGDSRLRFTVERFGDLRSAETVNYAVLATGADPVAAADFVGGVLPSGEVTFADGQSQAEVDIELFDDDEVEGEETFEIELTSPSDPSAQLGSNFPVIVEDDDSLVQDITGTDGDDDLEGNLLGNVLDGLAGNDLFRGFAGADQYILGSGASAIEGSALDLFGDTASGFGSDDVIRFIDGVRTLDDFSIGTGSAAIRLAGAAPTDPALTLEGDFSGGRFFVLPTSDGLASEMFFAEFLADDDFVDKQLVPEAEVNGGPNRAAVTGDGAREFELTLRDLGFAAFDNSLGVYEVESDGDIVDARLLEANTNMPEDRSVRITDVEAGNILGFFLVQDGSDLGLSEADAFDFVDAADAPANVADGADVTLEVNGAESQAIVFHSFDADLNPDGLDHARFGAVAGQDQLIVGFEDLLGGGDRDYEDIVFQLAIL